VTLLSTLALAVGLLVVFPYLAHRLRRKRAEEQPFPPARLVAPAPPRARRRSKLEDRALLATRSASVLLLALLGATPFVRCSRLSLQRSAGASVALAVVLDDSMSMRAPSGNRTRFERARAGAKELLASAGEGDAVAIILAGTPSRVALAATTDLEAARRALETVSVSDRGTDLDGAIALARSAVASMPQVDRRVVLLSDLADGNHEGPPLGADGRTTASTDSNRNSEGVPVWVALPELAAPLPDCGVLRADRAGGRVHVSLGCGPGASLAGRSLVVEDAQAKPLARSSLEPTVREVTLPLDVDAPTPVRALLTGTDAIASDDVAPVVPEAGRSAVAVVADAADDTVATGGAPVVEQAITSLKLDIDLRPLPAFPDRAEDLTSDVGILLDDPPGLTPEQRHILAGFVDAGGVVMLALGPRAAAAPLGASLEPMLAHPVAWAETKSPGADASSALGELAEASRSLEDLGAPRRASLTPDDSSAFEPLVRWTDGAPLVARRSQQRGQVWLTTLPFSADASDLPLRPAFLSILDTWVRAARDRAAPTRSDAGTTWKFPGAGSVEVQGPAGTVSATRDGTSPASPERGQTQGDGVFRVVPALIGAYRVSVDGKAETRVAAPRERELDLRPRSTAAQTKGGGFGERHASVDVSGEVALLLLALAALELALRIVSGRRARTQEDRLAMHGAADT
jgi:hypothetical protein